MVTHYGWGVPACNNRQARLLTVDRFEVTCRHCRRTDVFALAWYDNHRYPPGTTIRRIE